MKRESMIFYASFHEAAKSLENDADKAALYEAIFEYALYKNVIELSGTTKAMFTLIKPQLDANIRKYKNGKLPKRKQNKSKTEAKGKQTESKTQGNGNDNSNLNKNEELECFERFWNLYDKKVDRAKCEKKFNTLNQQEKEEILTCLPLYIKSTPDVQYRKNPLTYLNGRCWEDEVIMPKDENKDEPLRASTPKPPPSYLMED